MNGLDTKVLIRYPVVDDEAHAAKAKRYLESGTSYVSCIVLSEVVWMTESAYGYDKEAIIGVLERLLSTHELEVEDGGLARLPSLDRRIYGLPDRTPQRRPRLQ